MTEVEDRVFLSNFKRRVAQFVDRKEEMALFGQVLENTDVLVMVVSAATGMGKTSLLMKMLQECSDRAIIHAKIDWSSIKVYDFLAALREFCNELGQEHFAEFTKCANDWTQGPNEMPVKAELSLPQSGASIQVANNLQMNEHNQINTIAGVYVQQVVIQRADSPVSLQERRDKLTDLFLDGLARASLAHKVVLFFAVTDKMAEHTHQWMWEGLLQPIINRRAENVRVVLLGRPRPDHSLNDYQDLVVVAELQPLGQSDIEAYLRKRITDLAARTGEKPRIGAPRITPERLQGLLSMTDDECRAHAGEFLKLTGGAPGKVSTQVDIFLKSPAKPT